MYIISVLIGTKRVLDIIHQSLNWTHEPFECSKCIINITKPMNFITHSNRAYFLYFYKFSKILILNDKQAIQLPRQPFVLCVVAMHFGKHKTIQGNTYCPSYLQLVHWVVGLQLLWHSGSWGRDKLEHRFMMKIKQ